MEITLFSWRKQNSCPDLAGDIEACVFAPALGCIYYPAVQNFGYSHKGRSFSDALAVTEQNLMRATADGWPCLQGNSFDDLLCPILIGSHLEPYLKMKNRLHCCSLRCWKQQALFCQFKHAKVLQEIPGKQKWKINSFCCQKLKSTHSFFSNTYLTHIFWRCPPAWSSLGTTTYTACLACLPLATVHFALFHYHAVIV